MGYNAFMSGLDSSLSLALGSGVAETLGLAGGAADSVTKYISLGIMSSGAASNTLNNELMMGIPQGRAALDSMTAGLIEFATERIGMDNLFNNIINGRGNFMSYMKQVLAEYGIEQVDGIMLDLGVSSHQFDAGERGFSYRFDAPLDMRMDRQQSLSAKEVVNEYPEGELFRHSGMKPWHMSFWTGCRNTPSILW